MCDAHMIGFSYLFNMQKTLFLDAGNSWLKAASFDCGKWRSEGRVRWDDPLMKIRISDLCRPFERIVLLSVKRMMQISDLQKLLIDGEVSGVEMLGIDRASLPSDRIGYRTPETLGVDRYMACLGAWSQSQGLSLVQGHSHSQIQDQDPSQSRSQNQHPVVVTDAGTACTIDIMDADGIFRGGVIMPGLHMVIASLGEGADGLFRVAPDLPASWPPDTTEAALQAGTAGTFIAAWESHVQQSLDQYPDAQIWLTGGDADFLVRHTKRSCRIHDFLVFDGMQEWLKYR